MKDRLVFERTKSTPSDYCAACVFNINGGCPSNRNRFNCDGGYNYQLVEPEIKDQHTHNQERYFLLKNIGFRDILPYVKEIEELGKWLKDNPKECWVQCDKNNTKVGDVVRVIKNKLNRTVVFIFNGKGGLSGEDCVMSNDSGDYPHSLSNYEINIHKQGDR